MITRRSTGTVRGAGFGTAALMVAALLAGCQEGEPAEAAPGAAPVDARSAIDEAAADAVVAELLELEAMRLAALVDVDMEVLESLHGEDFRLIPPPGYDMDRDGYLSAVESGELDYVTFEPVTEIDVSVYGDAAVLSYRSSIHMVAEGLGDFEHETWHTYVYESTGAGWQVVWEQATAVGGFPPP